jgi:glycerol-3-phosphate dehydrogenase
VNSAIPPSLDRPLDLLVIGGGIHGVGVAQSAAARGYHVVVLEQTGLAAGTSSKSSKLIHGGLRYLETASIRLVRESLLERERLLKLAPSLVHRRDFYLPVYKNARRRPWQVRLGLSAYAILAGLHSTTRFRAVPRREWDSLDGLCLDGLEAVFCYPDAQTDDAALTRAVMKSAAELGAQCLTPNRFVSATRSETYWECSCRNAAGVEFTLQTRCIVNAAGPWLNQVRAGIFPERRPLPLDLIQGTHLELEGSLKKGCYYSETLPDHRYVFVLPWKGHILVGTTEHPYEGDPAAVAPRTDEIEYLLATYARLFPANPRKVLDAWTGLRVLPAKGKGTPFGRTRETILYAEPTTAPSVISILGGKLTGYRIAAERVLDRLARTLPARKPKARTDSLPLG